MKSVILALTIFSLFSCKTPSNKADTFEVEYRGAMRNVMQKGEISARVDLAGLQDIEHLYALGPVENLKGEILILNGKPYISSVQDRELTISNSFDHKATMLVYARVAKWSASGIPVSISTYEDLEVHIEQMAEDRGIDPNEPFPFLINGVAKSFDWHVIDWKKGDMEHTHEKHKQSGIQGTIKDREVEILGFYSKNHHGIFTHHSSNMHLHVKTANNEISGHLDRLALGQDMNLQLPDTD